MDELTLASVGLQAPAPAFPAGGCPAQAADPPGPGYVTVAFAEEKWAEREAAFAAQIAQLQSLVTAPTDSAAPSEVGDAEAAEQLNLDDDEAWSKVERGKRHILVRKEKELLAKKVRTGLGKVSPISSPFKKP